MVHTGLGFKFHELCFLGKMVLILCFRALWYYADQSILIGLKITEILKYNTITIPYERRRNYRRGFTKIYKVLNTKLYCSV